jgi:ferritin
MLDARMTAAINEQINKELYSAYLYQSMMAHCDALGQAGCAHWMRVQSLEETLHAYKFYDYVIGSGGKVTLTAIEGPPTEWASGLAAFEHVLRHEQFVTSLINALTDLARELGDETSAGFLEWYVEEQAEEEESAEAIIAMLRSVGDDPDGLALVDQELAARVFHVPASMPAAVSGKAPPPPSIGSLRS